MDEWFDDALTEELLFNAMRVCDAVLVPRGLVEELLRDDFIDNRTHVIRWMKQNLEGYGSELLDNSVRFLDSYLLAKYQPDPSVLQNKNLIAFIAAAAMSLGAKMSHSRCAISPSFFNILCTDDIIFLEKKMLLAVGHKASPLATPAFFIPHFARLCGAATDATRLAAIATALVSEFIEDPQSLLFAPSTIARSAVLTALALLKVDCDAMDRLPAHFFAAQDAPDSLFRASTQKRDYLDHDHCLEMMENMPSLRPPTSPCTVAAETATTTSAAPQNKF